MPGSAAPARLTRSAVRTRTPARLGRHGQPAQLEHALHVDRRVGLDRGLQLGVGLGRPAEDDLGCRADAGPGDARQGQLAAGGDLEAVDLGGERGEHVRVAVGLHRVEQRACLSGSAARTGRGAGRSVARS